MQNLQLRFRLHISNGNEELYFPLHAIVLIFYTAKSIQLAIFVGKRQIKLWHIRDLYIL